MVSLININKRELEELVLEHEGDNASRMVHFPYPTCTISIQRACMHHTRWVHMHSSHHIFTIFVDLIWFYSISQRGLASFLSSCTLYIIHMCVWYLIQILSQNRSRIRMLNWVVLFSHKWYGLIVYIYKSHE